MNTDARRRTLIAVTKLDWRFLKRKNREMATEERYDTNVITTNIQGIIARSPSLPADSWEASLMKTSTVLVSSKNSSVWIRGQNLLRQGVKSMTFKFATNFCAFASNMPSFATMYPGALTQTTSRTASKTRRMRYSSPGWEVGPSGCAPTFRNIDAVFRAREEEDRSLAMND